MRETSTTSPTDRTGSLIEGVYRARGILEGATLLEFVVPSNVGVVLKTLVLGSGVLAVVSQFLLVAYYPVLLGLVYLS